MRAVPAGRDVRCDSATRPGRLGRTQRILTSRARSPRRRARRAGPRPGAASRASLLLSPAGITVARGRAARRRIRSDDPDPEGSPPARPDLLRSSTGSPRRETRVCSALKRRGAVRLSPTPSADRAERHVEQVGVVGPRTARPVSRWVKPVVHREAVRSSASERRRRGQARCACARPPRSPCRSPQPGRSPAGSSTPATFAGSATVASSVCAAARVSLVPSPRAVEPQGTPTAASVAAPRRARRRAPRWSVPSARVRTTGRVMPGLSQRVVRRRRQVLEQGGDSSGDRRARLAMFVQHRRDEFFRSTVSPRAPRAAVIADRDSPWSIGPTTPGRPAEHLDETGMCRAVAVEVGADPRRTW